MRLFIILTAFLVSISKDKIYATSVRPTKRDEVTSAGAKPENTSTATPGTLAGEGPVTFGQMLSDLDREYFFTPLPEPVNPGMEMENDPWLFFPDMDMDASNEADQSMFPDMGAESSGEAWYGGVLFPEPESLPENSEWNAGQDQFPESGSDNDLYLETGSGTFSDYGFDDFWSSSGMGAETGSDQFLWLMAPQQFQESNNTPEGFFEIGDNMPPGFFLDIEQPESELNYTEPSSEEPVPVAESNTASTTKTGVEETTAYYREMTAVELEPTLQDITIEKTPQGDTTKGRLVRTDEPVPLPESNSATTTKTGLGETTTYYREITAVESEPTLQDITMGKTPPSNTTKVSPIKCYTCLYLSWDSILNASGCLRDPDPTYLAECPPERPYCTTIRIEKQSGIVYNRSCSDSLAGGCVTEHESIKCVYTCQFDGCNVVDNFPIEETTAVSLSSDEFTTDSSAQPSSAHDTKTVFNAINAMDNNITRPPMEATTSGAKSQQRIQTTGSILFAVLLISMEL